jgi:hypothetical protein
MENSDMGQMDFGKLRWANISRFAALAVFLGGVFARPCGGAAAGPANLCVC